MPSYNTSLPPLEHPLYGRHIAQLIERLKKIDSDPMRQAHAKAIVRLMERLSTEIDPAMSQHQQKVWSDLMAMGGESLKISPPIAIPRPKKKQTLLRLPYPTQKSGQKKHPCCSRYFDKVVERALKKASPEEKEGVIKQLIRWIQLFHKREPIAFLIKHLEKISGEKIIASPTLEALLQNKNHSKKRPHRFSKKKKNIR